MTVVRFSREFVITDFDCTAFQVPSFVADNIVSSTRTFGSKLAWGDVLSEPRETYDAFDKDIAVVEVQVRIFHFIISIIHPFLDTPCISTTLVDSP